MANKNDTLYFSIDEIQNFPNFEDFSLSKHFTKIGELIPNIGKERLDIVNQNSKFNDINGLVYALVINGKIFKLGKTDTTMKKRIQSYNCGKKLYRENGTCSTTNYMVLQSFLNLNQKVDVYAYYIPKATIEIFGEVIELDTSPSKYVEKQFLAKAEEEFGNKLPGCTQG